MNEAEPETIAARVGKNVAAARPRVSVVVPVYNVAPYIAETLASIFAQAYKDYEIVLVNDGSTDADALEIALAPYFDRIVYVEQKNAGASVARNAAIKQARGELLAFLDGDDVWLPDFLESQVNFLDKNSLEMVYCDALIFGETVGERRTFAETSPSSGAVTTVGLINAECNVITSGTVLKHDLFARFGWFDVSIRRGQDFEMWFRLAKNNVRIGYQRAVLLKYRVRAGNLTGTNVNRAERNLTVMKAIREKYDLNADERAAWENRMTAYQAELELESGKACLASGDYTGARTHLAAANRFYRKPQFFVMNVLLRFAPHFAAKIFKTLRPAEFAQAAPVKS